MIFRQDSTSVIFSTILIVFILGSFLGMSHMGMSARSDGTMGRCPFSPGSEICMMSPIEHISISASLFNSLPKTNDLLILIFSSISVLLSYAFLKKLCVFEKIRVEKFSLTKEYVSPVNFNEEVFSAGILNPKSF